MSHVSGIELSAITEPVRQALIGYQRWSEDTVRFELDEASRLESTPDKPNAARSVTTIRYLGEAVATMYVIAFRPGDGTGDETTYQLNTLDTGEYPVRTSVVPRSKTPVHTEAYVPLTSLIIDQPNADPVLYAGNQARIGVYGQKLVALGDIGQTREEFQASMGGRRKIILPRVSLTTGLQESGERFGDPHAIYNNHPEYLQVCGFFALLQSDATPRRLQQFNSLLSKFQHRGPGNLGLSEAGTNVLG